MLGVKRHVRVSDFASSKMLHEAMTDRFGEPGPKTWSSAHCDAMEKCLDEELLQHEANDHNTAVGLASLYEAAGGHYSSRMMQCVLKNHHAQFMYNCHSMFLKQKWLHIMTTKGQHKAGLGEYAYLNLRVDDDETIPDMPVELFLSDFLLPEAMMEGKKSKPIDWWDTNHEDDPSTIAWDEVKLRLLLTLSLKWTDEATARPGSDFRLSTANGLLFLTQVDLRTTRKAGEEKT